MKLIKSEYFNRIIADGEKRDWKNIIKPLVIIIILSGIGNSIILSEKETLQANVQYITHGNNTYEYYHDISFHEEKPVKFLFDPQKNNLVFFDKNEIKAKELSVERLGLEKFHDPMFKKEKDPLILYRAFELLPHNFYFFITVHGGCGKYCTWAFYRYDANNDALTLIGDKFFGAVDFFLSPQKDKVAIVRNESSGALLISDYLYIMDLSTQEIKEVQGFAPDGFASTIEDLNWLNDSEIEFTVNEGSYDYSAYFEKIFQYNIDTREFKLIHEQKLPMYR